MIAAVLAATLWAQEPSFFDGAARLPVSPLAAARETPKGAALRVRVFDGARRPLPDGTIVLLRVTDGNQQERVSRFLRGPEISVKGLPVFDNGGDDYRVIVSADRRGQAGVHPVHVSLKTEQTVDLMLLDKAARFDFSDASWDALAKSDRELFSLLNRGGPRDGRHARWDALLADRPQSAAGLLGIAAALEDIVLADGDALTYFDELAWDGSMAQDRFFGYVEAGMLDDMKAAVAAGHLATSPDPGLLHPGAFVSFKQIEFDEANVQFTFHPDDRKWIHGMDHLKLEVDIDLYRDLLAHTLLEVIPETLTHGLTDPRAVYQLRWMAARRYGHREFDPHYRIQ